MDSPFSNGDDFIHDNLIYGYDDDNNVLLYKSFNKNMQFTNWTISYSDFLLSYRSAKMILIDEDQSMDINKDFVLKFKVVLPDELKSIKFNLSKFMIKFYSFLTGKDLDFKDDTVLSNNNIEKVTYGIDTNFSVISYLSYLKENKCSVYNAVTTAIFEVREFLMKDLEFINENFKEINISDLILEYRKIVEKYNIVRLLGLKANELISNNQYIKYENCILKMKKHLVELYYEEKEILTFIYRTISNDLITAERGKKVYVIPKL